jgi:hypothetical protein
MVLVPGLTLYAVLDVTANPVNVIINDVKVIVYIVYTPASAK